MNWRNIGKAVALQASFDMTNSNITTTNAKLAALGYVGALPLAKKEWVVVWWGGKDPK